MTCARRGGSILASPRAAELDAKLGKFPFDQTEALARAKQWSAANRQSTASRMQRQWTNEFRDEYRQLREEAKQALGTMPPTPPFASSSPSSSRSFAVFLLWPIFAGRAASGSSASPRRGGRARSRSATSPRSSSDPDLRQRADQQRGDRDRRDARVHADQRAAGDALACASTSAARAIVSGAAARAADPAAVRRRDRDAADPRAVRRADGDRADRSASSTAGTPIDWFGNARIARHHPRRVAAPLPDPVPQRLGRAGQHRPRDGAGGREPRGVAVDDLPQDHAPADAAGPVRRRDDRADLELHRARHAADVRLLRRHAGADLPPAHAGDAATRCRTRWSS